MNRLRYRLSWIPASTALAFAMAAVAVASACSTEVFVGRVDGGRYQEAGGKPDTPGPAAAGVSGGAGGGSSAATGGAGIVGVFCETASCARVFQCVPYCGGPVVNSGCCPCGPGTFDETIVDCAWPGDSGAGGTSGAGGSAAGGSAAGGSALGTADSGDLDPCRPPAVWCKRFITCVEYCGGPIVSEDCCGCRHGTIDAWESCRDSGAGGDFGMGGSAVGGGAGLGAAGESCGECKRNFECVASCDGPIVSSSCCPCGPGTYDIWTLDCAPDGGR